MSRAVHLSHVRVLRIAIAPAALLFCLPWVMGLIGFAASIPDSVYDVDTRTDAIVVLTGGSDRVLTGLRLLSDRKAERVLVTGVHPAVDAAKLMHLAGEPPQELADRVDTGSQAQDTRGNAEEAAAWMRAHGFHSLRLVTSGYHMQRSLLEFAYALPDVTIIPHPVITERSSAKHWWCQSRTAFLIFSEYNKYLVAWALHALRGQGVIPDSVGSWG